MKKLLLLPLVAVALFLGATPASSTDDVVLTFPPSDENVKIKVEICHWASGNLSQPDVNISAVAGPQDTGHGMLTLTASGSLALFVPHTETGGHQNDSIKRIYLKKGNNELTLYAAETGCLPATTTTTTAPPPPPPPPVVIEKEVIKEVEKIVEVPVPGPTMVIERTITVPAAPAPAAPPAAAPTGELPRTGSGTLLTLIGAGLTGSGLVIRRLFK